MSKNTIFSTNYENFQSTVIEASHQQPILVDLWADWCSPCLVIAPLLEKIAVEFDGQIFIAKIEVDDGQHDET